MQSRTASAVETLVDIGSGFLVAWAVYAWVVVPYVPYDAAFTITCIFTALSLVRRYLWRRFFATGVHEALFARTRIEGYGRWVKRRAERDDWGNPW